MNANRNSRTSPTLLGRLRGSNDHAAWSAFVDQYGPLILTWCRRARLQDADGEDVAQQVLLRLAGRLKTFAYDPSRSFRGWLRTLTQHALSDFFTARERATSGSGDSTTFDALNSVESRNDLVAQLEAQFDLELLEEAKERVRLRVEPQTWDAFRLTALENVPGVQAAEQLGVRVTAIYKAKSRVQELIREEMLRLDEGESSAS